MTILDYFLTWEHIEQVNATVYSRTNEMIK